MIPPFPYAGCKRLLAPTVWALFGDVYSYIEPFAGTAAVLLARPENHKRKREIINDADGAIVNCYRAIRANPKGLADKLARPVCEADMQAAISQLHERAAGLKDLLCAHPDYYDLELAWYYAYAASISIGKTLATNNKTIPKLRGQEGVYAASRQPLDKYLTTMAQRLSQVNIANGDWTRVLSPAVLNLKNTPTVGILLDPPYENTEYMYAESNQVARDATAWCIEQARKNTGHLKIILCGYDNDGDELLDYGWEKKSWTPSSGMKKDRAAPSREKIWYTPNCTTTKPLF